MTFDAIVVGLGALGSAAARALARAGTRVLGLEQSGSATTAAPPTTTPASSVAPTTPRCTCAWPTSPTGHGGPGTGGGGAAGRPHGGLDLFPPAAAIPADAYLASLDACGVPYEWLDAAEVLRRWPVFRLEPGTGALWQADGGIVPAARGTELLQRLAVHHGATLLEQTPVTEVRDLGHAVEVGNGDRTWRAARLLLCADAWTNELLAPLGARLPLVVTQEQFGYFQPADPGAFAVGRFPVWIWMDDPSFYGFPVWPGSALKAAQDVGGREVTARSRGFDPDPAASERLAGFLRGRLPGALGVPVSTRTCLYTLTPDRDLVLGPLSGHDRVLVALGAAHGFKFAPLLGQLLADLALRGGTDLDLAPFDPGRVALTAPTAEAHYLV